MRHQLSAIQPETTIDRATPIGRLYDAGGRRLLLHHLGSGGPADLLNIHERVAEITASVPYDRSGTGWSGRVHG